MKHPSTAEKAYITEIFSSLQGEGTHLGERHLFIRFEECNIHCVYCDELDKVGKEHSQVDVLKEVDKLIEEFGQHSFVSLTGGEPLLYIPFLKTLIPELKKRGLRIHLETGGILWKALQQLIDDCDCVAMDMKTNSVAKEGNFDEDHRHFLKIARQKEIFVKIVVSNDIDRDEFLNQVAILADQDPEIPLLLMPLSSESEGHKDTELMNKMVALQKEAMESLSSVRIVPRFHKILNVR